MDYSNILYQAEGTIAIITINRPEKLNAINKATIEELSQAFKLAESDKAIRCIIVTGSGSKAFIAGADISEFAHFNAEEGKRLAAEGQAKLFDLVAGLSTPVIAAVNGFALGGGLELALSAHIRIASDNAKLGLPEVSLGVIPGYGGTQRLSQLAGRGKAMELILSAGMMEASEAMQWGVVNQVTSQEDLLAAAKKLAGRIARNSPSAIASAIKCVNSAYEDGVNGFQVEIDEFGNCFSTEDFKEGTQAFLEKRKPEFKGN